MDTKVIVLVLALALLVLAVLVERYLRAVREMGKAIRWLTAMSAVSLGLNAIMLAVQVYQCTKARPGNQKVIVKWPGQRRPRLVPREPQGSEGGFE